MLLLLFLGCSSGSLAPSDDPLVVADQVAMLLTEATLLRQRDERDAASTSWTTAYEQFEAHLEQPFRVRCGDRCTTRLEYGFARIRHAMERNAPEAAAHADTLGAEIQTVAATLKREADP